MTVDVRNRFFFDNCFPSPFLGHTFPDIYRIDSDGLYNPIIDAIFLNNPQPQVLSKSDRDFRWITLELEKGHRILSGTSIICQIRFFASLIYRCIQIISLDHVSNRPASLTEPEFLIRLEVFHTILDKYIHEAMPVHEAYALYLALTQLQRRSQISPSAYGNPEFVEKACLERFDDSTKSVYASLKRLVDRFGRLSPDILGISYALNIPWPPILGHCHQLWQNPLPPVKIAEIITNFLSDPRNSPTRRLQDYSEVVASVPIIGLSLLSKSELDDVIQKISPRLFKYITHSCLENCFCRQALDTASKADHSLPYYDPVAATLAVSCRLCEETNLKALVAEKAVLDDLGPGNDDLLMHELLMPQFLFLGNKCFMKDSRKIDVAAKLVAFFESIRQQMALPPDLQKKYGFPLAWSWDEIELDMPNDRPNLFRASDNLNLDILRGFWQGTRQFTFAKKWRRPKQCSSS